MATRNYKDIDYENATWQKRQTGATIYAKALYDPVDNCTQKKDYLHQKQLAYALGYPLHWRVERRVRKEDDVVIIKDQIWASHEQKAFMWMNHAAARKAAQQFLRTGEMPETSHLLPPSASYDKGDMVRVRYENRWFPAKVLKRRKKGEDFLYSVLYLGEESTQDDIEETDMRPAEDPATLAQEEGFPEGWKATRKGHRLSFTSPEGETFANKKAALRHLEEALVEEGDPPWRKSGHDFIGKQVLYTSEHQVSARRTISVEQKGTITCYIDEKDTDRQGKPGFVSTKTGKPANLFHVEFKDDPSHPYAHYLVLEQDLEEWEVEECLIDASGTGMEPSAKRQKKALYD